LEDTEFSSTTRLHPRFPGDFPLPRIFRLEYTYGGLRHGAVTVRFRFQGDPVDAVHDLIEAGRSAGWSTDIKAPHRVSFHKSGRTIDAWFGFPGHALVLDLPEPR
ncbi:MAG TPA: hypothetical protein VNL37_08465, partial [Candidatus Polarisedimenticolia bacterium]|nr:hypothetical protein [Candidatus Polarisedimenticolia bacterium]